MNVLDLFGVPDLPPSTGDFWGTLAQWNTTRKRILDLEKEADDKHQKAKEKIRKGRKKKDDLTAEELEKLRSPLLDEYNPILDPLRTQMVALRERMKELALTTPFRDPREEWCVWRTSSTNDYRSVGFGATAYARNAAEMYLVEAQNLGLEARIDQESVKETNYTVYSIASEYYTFRVAVKVHGQEDIDLLNLKPALSLRDWLKSCWKRGVNPRVLQPYLPPGLEEKLGIDYFGNDLVANSSSPFVKPSWVGEEVTHDPRYTNAAISTVPTR